MIHPAGTVPGDTEVWCSCHITNVPVRSIHAADKFLMISSLFSSAEKPCANCELKESVSLNDTPLFQQQALGHMIR